MSLLDAEPGDDGGGTPYRALRRDARFPYVVIGTGPEYEVEDERGTVDIDGGVLVICPFAVRGADDDAFLAAREAARAVLAGQRGYMGARLLRAAAAVELRFVELTRWSSPLMYARALALPELPAIPFSSHAAVYSALY